MSEITNTGEIVGTDDKELASQEPVSRTLPDAAQPIVNDWIGYGGRVLYFWKQYETYLVVAETEHRLLFLRLFEINGEWGLSQDGDCAR